MVVFGAIAPHGEPAFVEGSATRGAMEDLARGLEHAAPQVTVVLTPHNVHVEGAFAVVVSATVAGAVDQPGDELSLPVDVERAAGVLAGLRDAGLPALGVSFGSNDPALAVMPLDWGAAIPLWFLGGRAADPRPVVVVSPARELSLADHVRAGRTLAAALDHTPTAIVASADHGHAHDPDGPFGFHPAAADYDARVVELVRENRLGDVLSLEPIVEDAKADSLWQLAMLHGALGEAFEVELLSYECPTYFGMLCAAFRPRGLA